MIEGRMSVENDILATVVPDRLLREKVNQAASDLVVAVRKAASSHDISLDVRLVGSVAKDTYLGDPDIDVFILFPEDTPRDTLEKVGLSIGRTVVEGEERYAEHPYIHGIFQGFQVDLVPCYLLPDALHIKSAVDRTPFHTDYILSNLRPEQHDQVRLLKQFLKGVGVYGADAKVCGFSGYLAELLVLKYGDFQGAISAGSTWYSGMELALNGEDGSGFRSSLVFIDPVDRNRNVASALSVDAFATFVRACTEYGRKNDRRFFFPGPAIPLDMDEIMKRLNRLGTKVVTVRTHRPDLTDDNLYPQIQKTVEGLLGLLDQFGYKVIDRAYLAGDDVSFMIMLENDKLSDCTLHLGPPVWVSNSENFLKRWQEEGASRPFIKDGRWVVMAEREHPYAADLLRERYRVASLGSAFRKMESIEVFDHSASLVPEFREILSKMMDKRFVWER
jgi:tRNA nucleotidyltransferase (CCA-adding enzyme)